jgi:hypothetical protein
MTIKPAKGLTLLTIFLTLFLSLAYLGRPANVKAQLASAPTPIRPTPTATPAIIPFSVGSDYGDSSSPYTFKVSQTGCILAQISDWSPIKTGGTPAKELALILNGSDRNGYYARSDGSASPGLPLWISYAVLPNDLNRINTWTISVFNLSGSGTAKGVIQLDSPSTRVPCELMAAISLKNKGTIDLSWRYTGPESTGFFLVERSETGRPLSWVSITPCRKPITASSDYICSDSGLTSGTRYYYRACWVASRTSSCGNADITPPVSARAR